MHEQRSLKITLLGSSTIAGKGQAFNLIGELQKRPENNRLKFLNLGVGGDLSYNALQRIPEIVAAHPDKIIIMIGANDILASVFENVWRIFRITKHLPQRPSPEQFRKNLTAMVRELKEKTTASIAIASLPEVGEDPHSQNPTQEKLNTLYQEYAEVVRKVTHDEHVTYLPLYESLHERIKASPGRAFTAFRFLPFYLDTLRYFLLRKNGDEIARLNGWKLHVDGIHLNNRGGILFADLIQEFLRS